MLINDLYTVLSHTDNDGRHTFVVRLNPDCAVYQGHFPGNPVTPGVCSVQMVKECAEQVLGCKTMLTSITSCKYQKLITPQAVPEAEVHIALKPALEENTRMWTIEASIVHEGESYLGLKGCLNLMG